MDSVSRLLAAIHAQIDMTSRSGTGWLLRPLRVGVFKAIRPFIEHQQRVNVAVGEAVGDHDQIERKVASFLADTTTERADVLRELRNTQMAIRAVQERVADLETVRRATDMPPYASPGSFRTEAQPSAGTVLTLNSGMSVVEERSDYRVFEDVFRGPEALISKRQERYLEWVDRARPVVDAGCGRGEFLRLLAEQGITGRGVDLDAAMVSHALGLGLDVEEGDCVAFLEGLDPGIAGTVFASHLVEHLDPVQLQAFLRAAHRALGSAGTVLIETVNPHSQPALKSYWVDRTHKVPVFPEVLLVLCAQAGFTDGFAFCPYGTGDYEHDRLLFGEYAVVARR